MIGGDRLTIQPSSPAIHALQSPATMAYEPRVQRDAHSLTFLCWCGRTSRHRVSPSSCRIRCHHCGRSAMLGNAVFGLTTEPRAKPPADLAIPRSPDADGNPLAAELADERSITVGKWHSAEPVTLDMPGHDRALPERWRDRVTGMEWRAIKYAMGSRMLCAPVNDPTNRITVGTKEWVASMERVS